MSKHNRITDCISIGDLFDISLNIPSYQRPYSWSKDQVIDLIEDILYAFNKNKSTYLIGNMIFYESESLDIVDGQQRITTLALILKVLKKDTDFLNKSINKLSYRKIKENFKIIENKFINYIDNENNLLKFILKNVVLTFIKASNLDEAFVLFDSQNTRGKPLRRKDLLKVHHIRFIDGYDKQKEFAIRWEKLYENCINNNLDQLDTLLYNLSLIRRASRNELYPEDLISIDVFKEFIAEDNIKELNNYNQPPLFQNFDFDLKNNELLLTSKSIELKGFYRIASGLEYLPFEVIQSIEGGERFFLFIFKYYNLFNRLNKYENFRLLDNLSGNGNIFLKKIYQSIIIFYVDKFGFESINEFSMRLYILLFNFRYIKSHVRKDGIVKFKWDDENKLDIYKLILLKFSSNIVIKEIETYIEFNISRIDIENLSGVKKSFFEVLKENNKSIVKNILGKKYV